MNADIESYAQTHAVDRFYRFDDFSKESLPLIPRRRALYACQIAAALQEEDVLK